VVFSLIFAHIAVAHTHTAMSRFLSTILRNARGAPRTLQNLQSRPLHTRTHICHEGCSDHPEGHGVDHLFAANKTWLAGNDLYHFRSD
jgi:hypothetical protein